MDQPNNEIQTISMKPVIDGRKRDNSWCWCFRSSLEQQVWATEKLKQDLTEANARNALLAKEVDERHLQIEQSTEKKLR